MHWIKNKYFIFSALLVIAGVILVHTFLVNTGYTNIFYERFRDLILVVITGVISWYYAKKFIEVNQIRYLLVANLMLIIAAVHLLKIIFNGFPVWRKYYLGLFY